MLTKAVSVALAALLALTSVSLTVHDVHAESQATKPHQTQTSSKATKKQSSKTQTKKTKKQTKKNTKTGKQKQNRHTQATKQHQQNKSNPGKAKKTANKQQKQVKQLGSSKVSTSPALGVDNKKQGQAKSQKAKSQNSKQVKTSTSPMLGVDKKKATKPTVKQNQKSATKPVKKSTKVAQAPVSRVQYLSDDHKLTNRDFAKLFYQEFGGWYKTPAPHKNWSLHQKLVDIPANDPDREALTFTYVVLGRGLAQSDYRDTVVKPNMPFSRFNLGIFFYEFNDTSELYLPPPYSFTYASIDMASQEMGMDYHQVEKILGNVKRRYGISDNDPEYDVANVDQFGFGLMVMQEFGIADVTIDNLDKTLTAGELRAMFAKLHKNPKFNKAMADTSSPRSRQSLVRYAITIADAKAMGNRA